MHYVTDYVEIKKMMLNKDKSSVPDSRTGIMKVSYELEKEETTRRIWNEVLNDR